ncbi:hypothetical protein CAEBREN_06982 [Caenorhabditis brenneri]|uniref:PDZ domain-containing protein n=1 Tax=Caenorhabditis brenneri TaxID=135651 RepID=G0P0R2_CAEBE|nr:hypothetical protein CAEBREN_06982 [Caenorhabditis brenneri]
MPNVESYCLIKCKIYRAEDTDQESIWEKQGFRKGEIENRVKEAVMLRGEKLPNSYKLVVEATFEFPKNKAAQLGLVNRHGIITRVHYASPFKGSLQPGDVILQVNGTAVTFDDKTTVMGNVEDKTTSQHSKMKEPEKKPEKKEKPAPAPSGQSNTKDFKSVVSKIMASKTEAKITITVARLKNRVGTFKVPATIATSPGYMLDQAILYQYKYLKLGLNMQQVGPKVVVNYTTPDTVAHMSLNIGEAILAVDDVPVSTLEEVRQKILDGCNSNGWVRLIVEYPNTDIMKNFVRGQLATASKTTDRPNYYLGGDVKKYCDEGIEVLKTGKELDPIWKETEKPKDSDRKELEKKKSNRKANKKDSLVEFRKTTDEIGIPWEWNSKLFVVLPPLKTKETEMGTDNSQFKKQ